MLEAVGGSVDVAFQQIDFGAERLRPGYEGSPAFVCRCDRSIEHLGRGRQVAAQEQCATEHRLRVSQLLRIADGVGQCDGVVKQAEGDGIVRGVAQYRAVDDCDAGLLGTVGSRQRRGPSQPRQRAVVSAAQELDIPKFPTGRCRVCR